MAVILKEKKASQTRKRFDITAEKQGFFGDPELTFTLRLMSREELSDKDVQAILEEVAQRWSEKKETKSGQWWKLGFAQYDATAYIKKPEA